VAQNREIGELGQYLDVNTSTNTITINAASISIGNSSVNSSINSTSFSGTSNNTSFVGSIAAANVVSNAQLSSNLSSYQTTSGLSANVATLTANNANFVKANNGITSNSSGVFVTQGTGAVVNATGVHVNAAYINTISSNAAAFLAGNTVTTNSTALSVGTLSINASGITTNTFQVGTGTYFVSGGSVGVGTSSPVSKLDLRGSMQIGGSGLNQTTIHFVSNTSASGMLIGRGYYSNNQNDFFVFDQSASQMRLYIDPSGRVTKPYQPMFHADLSSGDLTTAQYIKFNNISYNVGSHYSSATGNFTAPVSGYYMFLCTCLSTSAGTTEIALYRNGTTIFGGGRTYGAAYAATPPGVAVYYLAANDTAAAYLTAGSIYGGGTYSYFSGYLLG
jgi:hypothetical protein